MINWLESNDFFRLIHKESNERWTSIDFFETEINKEKLIKLIPTIPDSKVEEFTEPCPCLKWYGLFLTFSFQVTLYLANVEFAIISLNFTKGEKTSWNLVKEFQFSSDIIKGIRWIYGNKDASISVFSEDENNLVYEIYRAENLDDANNLKIYLLENGFNKMLTVSESENLNLDWVVEKEGKEIARYTSRYTAESFALRKSKLDKSIFTVYSPELSSKSKVKFTEGKKTNSQ